MALTGVVERITFHSDGIEKYLGSGLIKGVGSVTAKRIVAHQEGIIPAVLTLLVGLLGTLEFKVTYLQSK